MTPATDSPARVLRPGEPIQATLAAGEVHSYAVEAAAGQYLRITAEQLEADVSLHWFEPDGTLLTSVDTPVGNRGTETVHAVTAATATHRLEVREAGTPGLYSLRIEQERPATDDDRSRVLAEQAFAAGEQLRREANPEAALESYQRALESFRRLGVPARAAQALHRIGWMAMLQKDMDEAAVRLREAESLFTEVGDEYWQLACRVRLGSVLVERYDFRAAIELLEPTAERLDRIGERPLLAGALSRLGDAYRWTGRPQEALQAFQRALPLFQATGDAAGQQSAWQRLGDLYMSQSELLEAVDALRRAQELAGQQGWRDREAQALTSLADALARQSKPNDALAALERALEIRRELADRRGEAVTLTTLGTVLLDLGQMGAAEQRFADASRIVQNLDLPWDAAMVIYKQARLRRAEGDPEGSLKLHESAAAVFAAAGEIQGTASARYGAALALHDMGRFWEAKEQVEAALKQAATLVGETDQLHMRTAYVAGRYHYWELYVDLLMHLHEEDPRSGFDLLALAASEAARARGLANLLREAGAGGRADVPAELRQREADVQLRLGAAVAARARLEASLPNQDPGALRQAKREVNDRLAELRAVQTEIRRTQPLFRELEGSEEDPLGRSNAGELQRLIQSRLETDTLLVVYALGEERSFVWALSRQGLIGRALPPRDEVEGLATRLAEQLHSRAPSSAGPRRASAAAFSNMVLGPVVEALASEGREIGSFRRLVVVADGTVLYVPFAALPLPGGDEPLIRDLEVVHLPSVLTLHSLRRLRDRRQPAQNALAVLADPVMGLDDDRLPAAVRSPAVAADGRRRDLERSARDLGVGGFPRLPATAREAQALAGLVDEDARYLALGFDASRETVVSGRLADYRILHFATHAVMDEQHPELSGLVLSLYGPDGQRRDGYLRLHELYALHLPAELVVLSACQTGLGRNYRGEGLVGLARGFMYAGSPRVVVSLWNVDDDDTAELMGYFYAAMLQERQPPARALRTAQLAMIEAHQDAEPSRWAGFVLLGDWRLDFALDDPIEGAETGGGSDPPPERAGDPLPTPGGDGDDEGSES